MERLTEYEPWDEYDTLRANPRDEFLTRVYIEGLNAARDDKPQTPPPEYAGDSLALINWEVTRIGERKSWRETSHDS